jgi:hypothetical protein
VAGRFVLGGEGLNGRPGDLVGLISFARFADSVCPLTLDHDYLVQVLDDVTVAGNRSEDGTAIGEAVALAAERLRDATERGGVPAFMQHFKPLTAWEMERQNMGYRNRSSSAVDLDRLLGVVLDARGSAGGGQWGGGSGINGVSNVTGKGYLLSGGATSSAFVNASLFSDATSGAYFTPAAAAVAVRVTFVLDAVYSITTVGLRVDAAALFVSLTSLLALFGIFGSIFTCAEELFCGKRAEAAQAGVTAGGRTASQARVAS